MKTILVVDDDKLNLNNAMKILSPAYKVIPVPSGKMALNYLTKNVPDLILLDILMPDMDGFEVMRQIRANEEGRCAGDLSDGRCESCNVRKGWCARRSRIYGKTA